MLRSIPLVVLASAAFLAGCGDSSPPAAMVQAEITRAVLSDNSAMFDGGSGAAEVVGIKLGAWTKEKITQPGIPAHHSADWTATLRFKEPIACILAEVDGTNIVHVVAEKGEEMPFHGSVGGMKWEGKEWHVNGSAKSEGDDFTGPGSWKPIWEKVPDLTLGYQVVSNGNQQNPKFRAVNFESLSRLKPCIIEGSAEHKKLMAEAQERWQKMQEAAAEQARQRQAALEAQRKQAADEAAERQRKQQEEQARLRAEAAEKQRLAQEEQERKRAEAAEKARLAAEEAKKKAEAERHARLLAVMKPFQSATGAVITAEAGPMLGTIILDATINDEKLAVSGRAIDLREMPFKEFTYDGSVDERGAFSLKTSLGGDAVAYGAAGEKLGSRAGFTIAALSEADRAKVDSLVALGKRLGGAAPGAAALTIESIDAEAAKTREPEMKLTGLSGSVFYRGRLNAAVAPLFAADLGANKPYAWRNKEVVSIRLAEPVKGSGLYIRGTTAPSTELIVTINGVHQATVASIPKLGGAVITLPSDLEVLEIRLEATGAVTARTIGLMK